MKIVFKVLIISVILFMGFNFYAMKKRVKPKDRIKFSENLKKGALKKIVSGVKKNVSYKNIVKSKKWKNVRKPVNVAIKRDGEELFSVKYISRSYEIEYYKKSIALGETIISMHKELMNRSIPLLLSENKDHEFSYVFKNKKTVAQVRKLFNRKFPVRCFTNKSVKTKSKLLNTLKNLISRQVYILRNEISTLDNKKVDEFEISIIKDDCINYEDFEVKDIFEIVKNLERSLEREMKNLGEKEKLKNLYKNLFLTIWRLKGCVPFLDMEIQD